MLNADELRNLEALLSQARALVEVERAAVDETVCIGDVVQLRVGACEHWQTSLLWVTRIRENGNISGIILRPHRSGLREAWYTYSLPEVCRIGRIPYPASSRAINHQAYEPPCPKCAKRY